MHKLLVIAELVLAPHSVMPCKKHTEIPPPPENANIIDPSLETIDDHGKWVTYNQLNPLIKKVKKQQLMYPCDIQPVSDQLRSYHAGKDAAREWNRCLR